MIGVQIDADDGDGVDDAEDRVLGVPVSYAIAGATILAFFLVWEALSHVAYSDLDIVFPSLVSILGALWDLLLSAEFYRHLWVTSQEVAISFALASVVGIAVGSVLGSNEFLADVFEPIIYYFSTVPKIILYPLFISLFGAAGIESKIAVGFLSAIFPIVVNTIAGAIGVRDDLVKVAKVNGASYLDIFSKVYVPSMITNIVNGLRLGVGVAIIATLFAELFASQAGLGNRIGFYFSNLYIDQMYAVLIFVFVVSFGLNLAILGLQQFLRDRGYGTSESECTFGF